MTTWSDVEQLRTDGKYRAALEGVRALRQAAQDSGDAVGWTRGLIQEAQLTIGLQSFETAVEQLRERPWPQEARYRAVLELVHAHTLMRYTQMNSWEIRQRERMALPEGELGVHQMTAEQIYQEAIAAYARTWQQREAWGTESLGEFAEYIEQNNYPARIRGTFRDAVTYLWVELLADTSNWTATENNELWRLDLAHFLADPAVDAPMPEWTDPSVHPLQKLVAALGDLEAWHLDAGRQEAAFEARLERWRRLSASFSEDDNRSVIQADLESRLEALPSGLPWHAMGRYQLARLLEQQDDLVAAREVALAGALAHPESMGGKLCRGVVDGIEAPSFDIQSMKLDGPRQRSVLIQHKNQPLLYFRAYRFDPLQRLKDPNLKGRGLAGNEVQQLVQKGAGDHQWTVDLPATPDYRQHQTYVTPPMTAPGLYAVVASTREDFNPNRGILRAVELSISDLVIASHAVGERTRKGGWQVTVRSGRTGAPLEGVDVTLYQNDWRKGPRKLHGARTDGEGQIRFSRPPNAGRFHYLLTAQRGEDTTVSQSMAQFGWRNPGEATERALIYTDRSVYRPGQTVQWKAVVYHQDGDQRRFEVAPQRQVSMVLNDANGEEVATFEGITNEFGSLAGSFEIPAGRLLGSWSLRSEPHAFTSLQVEEYKRPTFEVTLQDPAEVLRLNAPATLQGEARYYFGLPVSDGKADWRVVRQPVYPPWWGWYFRPMPSSSQTVAAGTSSLTEDGTFDVQFTPEVAAAEGSQDGVTYRYRVEVDVTNEGGETRSAERSFRLGHVAVEARVDDERAFFDTGDSIRLAVQRQDLDGLPREGEGSWRLLRVQQPETTPLPADQPAPRRPSQGDDAPFHTAGDDLRPRWSNSLPWRQLTASWEDGKELRRGELQHGADGRAEIETRSLKSGLYRLRYTTEDPYGQTFSTHHDFIVAGEGCDKIRLPLLLLTDRKTAEVGETVRVLIYSGLDDQQVAWRMDSGTGRVAASYPTRGVLHSKKGMRFLEIPVDAALRGDFAVQAELVRDHQDVSRQARVGVPWIDRELTLELATFRDRLRPGQEETWKVILRAQDGKALDEGAAELLAYMYDRSLDLFASHRPPRPLDLYPRGFNLRPSDFNLGSSRPIWRRGPHARHGRTAPNLHGDRLKFQETYGIGGPGRPGSPMKMRAMPQAAMAMESVAADSAPPEPPPPPPPPAPLTEGLQGVLASSGEIESEETGNDGSGGSESAPQVRSDFSETAFWHPQLRLEEGGAVSFSFQVPDSVTEWNVWLHAMTQDLRSARRQEKVRTVKELLVRPYLPRFFRQGDAPELRVVVDNAGENDLTGHLDLELFDVATEEDLTAQFGLMPEQIQQVPFDVAAGRSTTLTFPVEVPRRLGEVALRVVGRADNFSDGELRPLPVLPSRLHLAQSRFATLHDQDKATLHFADMEAGDDPSLEHEQLVVTVDGQLFYSVLHALPYLVTYPYSCSEQTLNRFVSTGIVSSLYGNYPAVARMAEQFSQRETVYESWDDDDPNRKMLLEETPWLNLSRGGKVAEAAELVNVLDPVLAAAQREKALDELRQAQTSGGGFPWWSGGPPSPYITTYILMGLSRALEFGVEVPQDMVQSAWQYLHQHFRREMMDDLVNGKCCVELATYLNFVLSSYPDLSWTGGVWTEDDRSQMLEASWRDWRKLSPLLKGYLTLTLARQDRRDDARLVWDSVMDSALTDDVQGTYWMPEERAWLWYNDTIEGHAFALRVLQELDPEDPRRHGLVQWLLLNKKLNHWKSTRATAEVLYSLVHYLQSEGGIAQREEAWVRLGELEQQFVFEPDVYTGRKNQWRLEGPEIDAPTMSTVTVEKETPGFLFASATWHYATDRLPESARGDLFHVERSYFLRRHQGDAWQLEPLEDGVEVRPGDQVEVHLTVRAQHAAEYVHLRDPRGAGFEPVDLTSGYRWDLGLGHYREIRDSGTNFFIEWLPAGEYVLKYRLRAALGGTFRIAPATVQSMYAPELVGFSAGHRLEVDGSSP